MTPPCGLGVTHESQGIDLLDFGFQVNDRFLSTTPFNAGVMIACILDPNNGCSTGVLFPVTPNANQALTFTAANGGGYADVAFWVIVF